MLVRVKLELELRVGNGWLKPLRHHVSLEVLIAAGKALVGLLVLPLLLPLSRDVLVREHLLVAGTVHEHPLGLEDRQVGLLNALRVVIVEPPFIAADEELVLLAVLAAFLHEDDLGRVDDVLIDHLLVVPAVGLPAPGRLRLVHQPRLRLILLLLLLALFLGISFPESTAVFRLLLYLLRSLLCQLLLLSQWILLGLLAPLFILDSL